MAKFLVTEESDSTEIVTTIEVEKGVATMSNTYCGVHTTLEDTGDGYEISTNLHSKSLERTFSLNYGDIHSMLYLAACLDTIKGWHTPLAMLTEMTNTIKWDKK